MNAQPNGREDIVSDDDTLCCTECLAVSGLWPRMQLARSVLQHRPPNAETVALALRALDGEPLDLLRSEGNPPPASKEVG